jgi:hypothetical protein
LITRDAAQEALRELALPTLAVAAFALLALPLLAESAVMVRSRALLDGTLALTWLLSVGSGLRLGTLLHGQGLGPLLRPALGDGPFLRGRLLGHSLVLAGQAALVLGLTALHAPVRAAGVGLVVHGVACAGEAVLAALLTALIAAAVRPWLGAVGAGALLLVGHLEHQLLTSLGASVARLPAQALLLLVPSVERLDVQGALIRHAAIDPRVVGVGLVELAGWCLLLGLSVQAAWQRTDRR